MDESSYITPNCNINISPIFSSSFLSEGRSEEKKEKEEYLSSQVYRGGEGCWPSPADCLLAVCTVVVLSPSSTPIQMLVSSFIFHLPSFLLIYI